MQGIHVRTELPNDFQAIDVVNLSAFEGEAEAQLVAELRQRADYLAELSLVAEFNKRLVGHCMLTPAELQQEKGGQQKVLLLAPMSVVPSQSHRGIGTSLVEMAVEIGKERGFSAIIAAGKPDYYARLGFDMGINHGIKCNLPIPEDALMFIELEPSIELKGGVVNYSSPFLSLY